VSVVISKA